MRTELLAACGVVLLSACTPQYTADTCVGGNNFANVRLDPANLPVESQPQLDVLFDRVAGRAGTLPDGYYAAAVPIDRSSPDGGSIVSAVTLVSSGHLRFELSQPIGDGVSLNFRFPDRRAFTTCRHPGMDDSYELSVSAQKLTSTVASPDAGYTLMSSETMGLGAI